MAFDPAKWTDEEYRLVEGQLQSLGWQAVMAPMLEMAINGASELMGQHIDARPTPKWSDDYYKGYRDAMRFARFHWEQRLRERVVASRPEPNNDVSEPSGSPYTKPEGD